MGGRVHWGRLASGCRRGVSREAYCSEACGGKPGTRHALWQSASAQGESGKINGTSVAPAEHKIAVPVHGVAVVDVGVAHLAGLRAIEFHVTTGAKPLQDGIETLIRPLQLLTETVDGNPALALADTIVGGPKLPTQGLRR